jgi:hypothetical protein
MGTMVFINLLIGSRKKENEADLIASPIRRQQMYIDLLFAYEGIFMTMLV